MWRGISILWLLIISIQSNILPIRAGRQFSESSNVQYLGRTTGYYQLPDTQLNTQNEMLLDTLAPLVQQLEEQNSPLNQAKQKLPEAQTAIKNLKKAIDSFIAKTKEATDTMDSLISETGNEEKIALIEARLKINTAAFNAEKFGNLLEASQNTMEAAEMELANVMPDDFDQISRLDNNLQSIISSVDKKIITLGVLESDLTKVLGNNNDRRFFMRRKKCQLNNFRREEIVRYLISNVANRAPVFQPAKYPMPVTFLPALLRSNVQRIHHRPSMQSHDSLINKPNVNLINLLKSEIHLSRYNREIFPLRNLQDQLSFLKNLLSGLLINQQNQSLPSETQNLLQEIAISENELLQHIEMYKKFSRYENMLPSSSTIQDEYREKVDNLLRNAVNHLSLKQDQGLGNLE